MNSSIDRDQETIERLKNELLDYLNFALQELDALETTISFTHSLRHKLDEYEVKVLVETHTPEGVAICRSLAKDMILLPPQIRATLTILDPDVDINVKEDKRYHEFKGYYIHSRSYIAKKVKHKKQSQAKANKRRQAK